MKTENGAPKFEMNELLSMTVTANEKLRAWADSRRCTGCKNYTQGDNWEIPDKCLIIGEMDIEITPPNTFSCAAFEERGEG